jgi:membrane associated rhomboid family serine protease
MMPTHGSPVLFVDAVVSVGGQLPIQQLLLLVTVLIAVGTLLFVSWPNLGWLSSPRERLIGGVPWGTLLVSGLLVAVYYGLQGGLEDPTAPVVLPFRAWSYFDPFGMVLAGFSHANYNHLTANLISTLIFGSIAEYWWGHYTKRRIGTPWEVLWTNPVARAVVIFPAVTILVGIVGTVAALGPIIGFSTVVFAFAGFSLVRYPIAVVIAGVGQGVVSRLFDAVRLPQQVAVAEASYSTPWFASVAVQGHAIGLLFGVLIGLAVLRLRDESPPPASHVWLGTLLFGVSRSLWAIYWYRGNEVYVLYRALGLALVFVLVTIVTYSIVARREPLFRSWAVRGPQTIPQSLVSITYRDLGLLLLVCGAALIVGPAITVNLTTADDAALPGEAIETNGYEITYAENVPDGQISAIPLEGFGETTQINTSGVIVRNADRHIWATAVPTGQLASQGSTAVRLGGLGWRESVIVDRTGWRMVGGESTYLVSLTHDNRTTDVFSSGRATAEPVIAGRSISINTTDGVFLLAADPGERNSTENTTDSIALDDSANGTETATTMNTTNNTADNTTLATNTTRSTTADRTEKTVIPAPNESTMVGPIEIVNRADRLFAVHNGTVVRVAQRE